MIEPATKSQSGEAGTYAFPGALLDIGTSDIMFQVPLSDRPAIPLGALNMTIDGTRVTGLNSVGEMELLSPIPGDPRTLHNLIDVGAAPNGPIRIALDFFMQWVGGYLGLNVLDLVKMGVSLGDATLLLDVTMLISYERLWRVRLDHMLLQECWLSVFDRSAPEAEDIGSVAVQLAKLTVASGLRRVDGFMGRWVDGHAPPEPVGSDSLRPPCTKAAPVDGQGRAGQQRSVTHRPVWIVHRGFS